MGLWSDDEIHYSMSIPRTSDLFTCKHWNSFHLLMCQTNFRSLTAWTVMSTRHLSAVLGILVRCGENGTHGFGNCEISCKGRWQPDPVVNERPELLNPLFHVLFLLTLVPSACELNQSEISYKTGSLHFATSRFAQTCPMNLFLTTCNMKPDSSITPTTTHNPQPSHFKFSAFVSWNSESFCDKWKL